ncbi:MAG: hypothetical protein JW839_08970 [Candidatus Lokiarchaeota archaeon]|nr:hypothetical protein [Candidatus Lokiarchaeota archaeon]
MGFVSNSSSASYIVAVKGDLYEYVQRLTRSAKKAGWVRSWSHFFDKNEFDEFMGNMKEQLESDSDSTRENAEDILKFIETAKRDGLNLYHCTFDWEEGDVTSGWASEILEALKSRDLRIIWEEM